MRDNVTHMGRRKLESSSYLMALVGASCLLYNARTFWEPVSPTMGVKRRQPCYECKRRDFDTGKKFLCSRRGLSQAQRIEMWSLVLKPCLLYALDCLPLTGNLIKQVQTMMMKQIRAITGKPSHSTRQTDAGEGLQTRFVLYKPMAVICREGKYPQSGHYICMLLVMQTAGGYVMLHVLFHGCFGLDPTRTRSMALSHFLSRDSSEDWAGAA